MTEYDPNNFTHVYLLRIDERTKKMDTKMDRLGHDMHDIKVRLTGVENNLAGVQLRIDRLEDRVERIENRLDIREDAMFEAGEKFEDQHD